MENESRIVRRFCALIIGDELLSGKRSDKHMPYLIEALHKRGLKLDGATFIRDDPKRLIAFLRSSFDDPEQILFSFGGIGGTPDDHTRQCAAAASDQVCAFNPVLRKIILKRFGNKAYPSRINISFIPANAKLIPNPINQIAGFSVCDAHFVPGFPEMAQPMINWVLDEYYQDLFKSESEREVEYFFIAYTSEGEITYVMEEFVHIHKGIAFSSLPMMRLTGPCIEFGFTGTDPETQKAASEFRLELISLKYKCDELVQRR